MYFDEIRKKMTQTTKYFEIVDANILTTKITFYTMINLLTLATKDYLEVIRNQKSIFNFK